MTEKQMKTLGGYEIVDEKAREDIRIVEEKATTKKYVDDLVGNIEELLGGI